MSGAALVSRPQPQPSLWAPATPLPGTLGPGGPGPASAMSTAALLRCHPLHCLLTPDPGSHHSLSAEGPRGALTWDPLTLPSLLCLSLPSLDPSLVPDRLRVRGQHFHAPGHLVAPPAPPPATVFLQATLRMAFRGICLCEMRALLRLFHACQTPGDTQPRMADQNLCSLPPISPRSTEPW